LLVHLPVLVLWCGFNLVRGEDVFIVLFVPCLLSVPLLVSCAMLWGFGRVGARATNRRHKLLVAFGLFCVCLLASYVTRWPFHAAFAVSRPALERLVQRAEQGQLPSGPVWAGVFRVERIDQRDGHWALWIETRTSGPDALVYASPAGGVPNSFNIWGHEQLDARWHIVNED